MIDKEFNDVSHFRNFFGLAMPETLKPVHLSMRKLHERIDFMKEELREFETAAEIQDMPGMADALVDLIYVAKGTAAMMGLPWDSLWREVQRANMSKALGDENNYKSGIIKPPGWTAPDIEYHLRKFGYQRHHYCLPGTNVIDNEKCDDRTHKGD